MRAAARSGIAAFVSPAAWRFGVVEHPHRAVEVTASLQHPRHSRVPAVPVLQQRRPVTELAGQLEVVRGRVEVTLLAEHVGQADVQVTGRGQQ